MLSLNMSLVYNIINLIVLYLLLKHFLFKPVTAIMDKRRKIIEDGLADARNKEQEALDLRREYEKSLEGAKIQSDQILEQARTDAKQEYDKILKDASVQAGKLLKQARETMDLEREQTLRDMKSEIAGLAMTAAEKILKEQKDGADQAIYDQFLGRAGEASEDRDNH